MLLTRLPLAVLVQAPHLRLARSREGDRAGAKVAGADSAQVQLLQFLYLRSFLELSYALRCSWHAQDRRTVQRKQRIVIVVLFV